jgi:hypothetical protein
LARRVSANSFHPLHAPPAEWEFNYGTRLLDRDKLLKHTRQDHPLLISLVWLTHWVARWEVHIASPRNIGMHSDLWSNRYRDGGDAPLLDSPLKQVIENMPFYLTFRSLHLPVLQNSL